MGCASGKPCCCAKPGAASDPVQKGTKLPMITSGQEDTQKGEAQVNNTTLTADDGDGTPHGAAIRQGLDQFKQMAMDERKGHGPFNGDVLAWMEFRKNQDDAVKIRLAKTLPPKCKPEDPFRFISQFLESANDELQKTFQGNTQEQDNGDETPTGRAIRQGWNQIRQRQIDEEHGFDFKDHSEWKSWDEKQPPAAANGRRNGALADDDGDTTPHGAAIRLGLDQFKQMAMDERKGHGPFNGDVLAWMEFRKNLSDQDDAVKIRLTRTLPPKCKREDPFRFISQFLESAKDELQKTFQGNTEEQDNGDETPTGRAIRQGWTQIRQRQIDEEHGNRFNDHSGWKSWDEKQPPADALGQRPNFI
jgi:hypothetical protein